LAGPPETDRDTDRGHGDEGGSPDEFLEHLHGYSFLLWLDMHLPGAADVTPWRVRKGDVLLILKSLNENTPSLSRVLL
jgi:hypothetical protein